MELQPQIASKQKVPKQNEHFLFFYCLIHFFSLSLHSPSFHLLVSFLSGPSPNSPTLATLSGDLSTPFNLTTSGHQFLVRWSSDHGTNKKGFKIRYVGEYQSMYPNFILLLLYIIIIIMHVNKDRVDRQKDEETFSLEMHMEWCKSIHNT